MAVEDFTTYTEVDPNSRITVTSTRVTWASLTRDEDAYVYDDKGANHFSGDFEHLLTVRQTGGSASGTTPLMCWAITNLVDDWQGINSASGDGLAVRWRATLGGDPRLGLVELDGGTEYISSLYVVSLDTDYYLKIVRDESVGTYGTLYLYIYSDSARTNLLSTLSITLNTSKKDYRYIFAVLSIDTNEAGITHSGYTENLTLSAEPFGSATVTTQECTDTTARTSTGHGLYSAEGDSSVTQHGHVWSTSASPKTSDSKTENGASPNLGQFSSNITGLTPNTLYYVAAYATNTAGTSYGSDVTITTGTTIERRYIWTEGTDFHYFDAYGTERVLQGHSVASDKDILPWLDPFS